MCHVDDILFTGTENELHVIEAVLRTSRPGKIEKLTAKSPIVPDGFLIERHSAAAWTLPLPQSRYSSDLRRMNTSRCVREKKVIGDEKLRKALRQKLGSLIRRRQTRPDIGYDIAKLAGLGENLQGRYFGTRNTTTLQKNLALLREPRPVVFTDAGFGTLSGSRSIEGPVAILSEMMSRGGAITCQGVMLAHRFAKIQRTCKSSLAAECRAALTAADQALWLQTRRREIFTGKYDVQHDSPASESPRPDPFGKAPTDVEAILKLLANNHKRSVYLSHCVRCDVSRPSSALIYEAAPNRTKQIATPEKAPALVFRPLVQTDCCSPFSSILRIQPRSTNKCAMWMLDNLRDLALLLEISPTDNSCNLGDVETKHSGLPNIVAIYAIWSD